MSNVISKQAKEEVVNLIQLKAKNLYESKQLYCSEAVLVALNNGFGGGLSEKMSIGLSSAFPVGIGNSGCLCGAVGGGLIAIGLLLSEHFSRSEIRDLANILHHRFKNLYSSTCCRVLTRNVKDKPKEHFSQCAGITEQTAKITAEILLEARPELIYSTNISYLKKQENIIVGLIKRFLRRFI